MTGKHETPSCGRSATYAGLDLGGSVRELEKLACELRLAGDDHNTERVDQRILFLLEQKIYRKLVAQNRRKCRLTPGNAYG